MQPDDDDAWQRIVDHYGDRVDLDPDEFGRLDDALPPASPGTRPPADVEPAGPSAGRSWDDPDDDWSTDRFVPPPPPPVPSTSRERRAAWLGLIGAPSVIIVLVLAQQATGRDVPGWLLLILVGAFACGFGYLVVTMSREPRDPGDDGAVL